MTRYYIEYRKYWKHDGDSKLSIPFKGGPEKAIVCQQSS